MKNRLPPYHIRHIRNIRNIRHISLLPVSPLISSGETFFNAKILLQYLADWQETSTFALAFEKDGPEGLRKAKSC